MALAAALALLALLAGVPQGRGGTSPREREQPPVYPYLIRPVGALSGYLLEGPFKGPTGVFWEPSAGELYVADGTAGLIGIFDAEGTPRFAFGRSPLIGEPRHVAATAEGSIYALDTIDGQVRAFSYRGEPRGTLVFEYPALGELPAGRARPACFTLDSEGRVYVGDGSLPQVLAYEADLSFRFAIRNQRAGARFEDIADVAVSAEGLIAVTDRQGTPVQVFDADGHFVAGFGRRDLGAENFSHPTACAFDGEGHLFVVDMLRHDVKIFEPSGTFLGLFGGWAGPRTRGRGLGELRYPMDIALGPGGRVWVAERFGRRVQVFRRQPREPDPSLPEEEGEGSAGTATPPR